MIIILLAKNVDLLITTIQLITLVCQIALVDITLHQENVKSVMRIALFVQDQERPAALVAIMDSTFSPQSVIQLVPRMDTTQIVPTISVIPVIHIAQSVSKDHHRAVQSASQVIIIILKILNVLLFALKDIMEIIYHQSFAKLAMNFVQPVQEKQARSVVNVSPITIFLQLRPLVIKVVLK